MNSREWSNLSLALPHVKNKPSVAQTVPSRRKKPRQHIINIKQLPSRASTGTAETETASKDIVIP